MKEQLEINLPYPPGTCFAKILFVDDDPTAAKSIAFNAEVRGNQTQVVASPEEAQAILVDPDRRPEQVVSDGLDGEWRAVVAASQEYGVPCAVLSADASIADECPPGVLFFHKSIKGDAFQIWTDFLDKLGREN